MPFQKSIHESDFLIENRTEVLSIPFVVVCLTLAIRGFVLYLVRLRIAKVKQTTTNGIDSTSVRFSMKKIKQLVDAFLKRHPEFYQIKTEDKLQNQR